MAKRGKKQNIPAVLEDLDRAPLVKAMDGGDAGGDDAEGEGDDEEEDEDEGDDDEEEDDGPLGKSLPGEDDLLKAMNNLGRVAQATQSGGSLRRAELAEKMAAGENLTKSETAELKKLIDGTDAQGEPLVKSHRETFVEDPQLAQGVEISDFLDAQVGVLSKSLDDLRDAQTTGHAETRTMLSQLAKGMHAIGNAQLALFKGLRQVASLQKSAIEHDDEQPAQARGRTSRVGQKFNEQPVNEPMNKGGQRPNNGPVLSKADIGATLDELIKSTEGAGPKGFGMVEGVDLVKEQAKFEQVGQLSPSSMRLVLRKKGIDPAAVGLA